MIINLLAIAQSQVIKQQGLDVLLNNFIVTINELNINGLSLKIFNERKLFQGFLAFSLGDNLALHWIGGFFEKMSKAI
jgi:hypothetical protein